MGRRNIGTGATVVALSALVAACGSGSGGGSTATADGAPIVRSATAGPGTDLPDGFRVPPGSLMLGPVLPTAPVRLVSGTETPQRGWSALLLVTGDPYDALDDVRLQATRAGMPASLSPAGCQTNTFADRLECQVDAHSAGFVEHPSRGAGFSARLIRGPGGRDRAPMSHLSLSYVEVLPAAPRDPVRAPPPTERTVKAPPFPDDWPALRQPGDRIVSPTIRGESWVVEEGTRLVGPPSYDGCGTGGFDAVFEVTGDPQRVVDGYARQFAADDFYPVRPPFDRDAPGTGPSARSYGNGEGDIAAVVFPGPAGTKFLRLSRCND